MRYFKTPPEHRTKAKVLLVLFVLLLVTAIVSGSLYGAVLRQAERIPGTDAAARWTAPDSLYPFAQISAYFDDDHAFVLTDVFQRRMQMQKALEQNAISPADEDARIFIDSFSGQTDIRITSERDSVSVLATAAGGDFFFFHPLELLYGDYFSGDDLMVNTLILDEYAAWQLFGATEVAGMEVTISGQPFLITGVTKAPDDALGKEAYGSQPRAFVNYVGLRLAAGFDEAVCYEAILPNPIRNFAADQMKQICGISDESRSAVLYDATTRFSYIELLKKQADFFSRTMRFDRVIPPYWENIARVAESKAILLTAASFYTGIAALLLLIAVISLWFLIHPIRIRAVYSFFDNRIEKRRMEKWLLRQKQAESSAESVQPEGKELLS